VFRQFGAQELLIILLIVVLLFGAKKLPDTARGLGRSLRIFKAETKGLTEDEKASDSDAAPQITSQSSSDHQPVAAPDPASRPAAESTHSDERS
jgi:sec-independent protein translocase protein TatA